MFYFLTAWVSLLSVHALLSHIAVVNFCSNDAEMYLTAIGTFIALSSMLVI